MVVSDDPVTVTASTSALASLGVVVEVAASVERATAVLGRRSAVSLIVSEAVLPDGTILTVMGADPRGAELAPVVVVTSTPRHDLARLAIERGAAAIVTKPVTKDELVRTFRSALESPRLAPASTSVGGSAPFTGTSPAVRVLEAEARRAASSDLPVLIAGETGTGKGVLARWIHAASARHAHGFVDVNCASLSRDLFESELFGFEKGAFTGAATSKVGLLEAAHLGTVFLDEIGDLDLAVQPRLLKVLEDGRFRRLGSVREQQSNLRLIAASNRDLPELARQQRFRPDLLFRINTLTITCPPLRHRREDLPTLVEGVIDTICRAAARPRCLVSPKAMQAMTVYPWPGNLRELHHVLQRAVLLNTRGVVEEDDLRLGIDATPDSGDEGLTLEAIQLRHIQAVLEAESWNVDRAAVRLGIPRSSLYQKIKTHGLWRLRGR
jgi:DNA-binding NtrC family response regulator